MLSSRHYFRSYVMICDSKCSRGAGRSLVNPIGGIMLKHKVELEASGVETYHASLRGAAVPNLMAVATVFLFLTLDGSAFAESIDPASAIRGSLGVSLASLSFSDHLGALSFVLNGGFAVLCGAIAVCLAARSRGAWRASFGHQRKYFAFLLSSLMFNGQPRPPIQPSMRRHSSKIKSS